MDINIGGDTVGSILIISSLVVVTSLLGMWVTKNIFDGKGPSAGCWGLTIFGGLALIVGIATSVLLMIGATLLFQWLLAVGFAMWSAVTVLSLAVTIVLLLTTIGFLYFVKNS